MTKQPHAIKNRKRCGAKTRSGGKCKNWAMNNGRCRMHGGKSTGPPKKNSNARTHGLFAKYLPDETLEIMNSINDINPIDILWTNIKMQFASIIRAQQIMYVENKDDHTTFETKERSDEFTDETQIEVHASWDKQATFMNSLSRSMGELRNMIKQYDELLKSDMVTEEQRTRIELLKAQLPNTNTDDMNKQIVALADLINNPADDRVIDDE